MEESMPEINMTEIAQLAYNWVTNYAESIIGAILLLILGRIAISIVVNVVGKLMDRSSVDATLSNFVVAITKIGLLAFLIIAVLEMLGVQTASFVVVIGAAGLAIGFALQGSLSNFAAGVMLIIFRPFKAGDYVEAGGMSGTVEAVDIFVTRMKSPDNREIIIPNSQITSSPITNYSAKEMRRVDLVFGIGYDDDIKLAKETLEAIVTSDARILHEPAPTVAVSELGDSSVNFVVRPWVKTADYWAVYFDLTEKVKLTFDEKGISIPFPQTDVHLHQVAAS
jgi:small conductance mechanosensitive channel